MKLLAVSDVELPQMQSVDYLCQRYEEVDLLVSCGDMPASYLEFIATVINVPLYYVRGNHDTNYKPPDPGGDDLHRRFKRFQSIWMAGLEGSIRYNDGAIQYAESAMFRMVLQMMPRLLWMRARRGYSVDVFVVHSPPRHIHDIPTDYAHRGFRSFRYLAQWARPRYLIHGHVDTWDRRKTRETRFGATTILNINPVMLLEL